MVNWDNYNESLVRRGEVILDFDVIDRYWDNELDNMNNGKERKVVVHPIDIQILLFNCLIGYMREHIFIYHIDRQTEGVVREIYTGSKVRSIPADYSTINKED